MSGARRHEGWWVDRRGSKHARKAFAFAAVAATLAAGSAAAQPAEEDPTDLATVRIRGGLGALAGVVTSAHRIYMNDCETSCRSSGDTPRTGIGWALTSRLGVTTDRVGVYYLGTGPVWAYAFAGDDEEPFGVSLPHSILVGLLPSDDVEIALGPTFSWVGAWDPWAFGGTLAVTSMIDPTITPEGFRRSASLSALVTPLVDTFGRAWMLVGLGGGYDWY